METITVTILPGGKKAKEVNRLTKLNYKDYFAEMSPVIGKKATLEMYHRNNYNWDEAEQKLRTFDIENIMLLSDPPQMKYKEGQVFEAQIINETKIRIV